MSICASLNVKLSIFNKQPMGCEAQLAWKCLFTPGFIDQWFGQ